MISHIDDDGISTRYAKLLLLGSALRAAGRDARFYLNKFEGEIVSRFGKSQKILADNQSVQQPKRRRRQGRPQFTRTTHTHTKVKHTHTHHQKPTRPIICYARAKRQIGPNGMMMRGRSACEWDTANTSVGQSDYCALSNMVYVARSCFAPSGGGSLRCWLSSVNFCISSCFVNNFISIIYCKNSANKYFYY